MTSAWQTVSFISGWATKWANELLPIATEAHAKLTFHANPKSWGAKSSDLPTYDKWAREQVSLELGRAGYRLARHSEKGLAVRAALRRDREPTTLTRVRLSSSSSSSSSVLGFGSRLHPHVRRLIRRRFSIIECVLNGIVSENALCRQENVFYVICAH